MLIPGKGKYIFIFFIATTKGKHFSGKKPKGTVIILTKLSVLYVCLCVSVCLGSSKRSMTPLLLEVGWISPEVYLETMIHSHISYN